MCPASASMLLASSCWWTPFSEQANRPSGPSCTPPQPSPPLSSAPLFMRIHTRSCCDGLFRGLVVTIHRVELKPTPSHLPSSHICTWMPLLGFPGRGMRRGSSLESLWVSTLPLLRRSTPRPQAPHSKVDSWVEWLLNRTFGSYTLATLERLSFPWDFVSVVTAQFNDTSIPRIPRSPFSGAHDSQSTSCCTHLSQYR